MRIPFYILDVFAERKYQGNQLAVFLDETDEMSAERMQQMAREINFAESAFIKARREDGKFAVRIFTPEHEVPFAGHPSIGASFIISKFILSKPEATITLAHAHADIEITFVNPENMDAANIFMQQATPTFGEILQHEEIAKELKIPLRDLNLEMPIQEISTGLPYIIIPLKNLKAMENLKFKFADLQKFLVKREKYKTNSVSGHSTSVFFFTSETYDASRQFNTRMLLCENDKLSEDAATGSANGCFLAYLLEHAAQNISATVEQGFQMGRPSILFLNGDVSETNYTIKVGGKSQLVSEGFWHA